MLRQKSSLKSSLNWLRALLLTVIFVSLSAAAQAQTTLYRSVGTDNTDLNTGKTVEIVGTTATFSTSMPNNIGVGDVLEYGTTNLAFISGRTSATVYTVQSSTGGTPVATGAGTAVSVFRAYTSLYNWETQDENDAIADGVENFDTSKALVANNTVMQVAAYADGPDTGSNEVKITTAWVTGANNYIRIFTPISSNGSIEDAFGGVEINAVLVDVGAVLGLVPLKPHCLFQSWQCVSIS